jgi:hypothetical protein
MCTFCDALEQWVCDCCAIVPLGEACECGQVRTAAHDLSETIEVVFVDGEFNAPNRAARRRRR